MRILAVVAAGLAGAALAAACTPDVGNDPLPEEMEFNPTIGRVSEPSFVVTSPTTGLIDLSLAGIDVPADCTKPGFLLTQAQCEFSQYLESLDGFPTNASARTPVTAAIDAESLTPANIAVVEAVTQRSLAAEVNFAFEPVTRYLQVAPKRTWPVGAFVWLGVRGYAGGVRAGGKPVVASTAYNLLKREDSLACQAPAETCAVPVVPAAIPVACPYFQLLAQQMAPAAAQANIAQLEQLRCAMKALGGWTLLAGLGGLPKAEAAIAWGFRVHTAPVIELDPGAGQVPELVSPSEVHLTVNGELDPATVAAYRLGESVGSVFLLNTEALDAGQLGGGFPRAQASYAAGKIAITTEAPLAPGTYAVVVSRAAKSPAGKGLVPPPAVALVLAHGTIATPAGLSQVSGVSNAQAVELEANRLKLKPLLDNIMFAGLTGLSRANIAYVGSVVVGAP